MTSINTNRILNAPELHISIFAFLLNFVWELLQMPLFAGFADFPYYRTILHCMKATFGDIVFSLVAFAGACLITRSRMWIISMSKSGAANPPSPHHLAVGLKPRLEVRMCAAVFSLQYWQRPLTHGRGADLIGRDHRRDDLRRIRYRRPQSGGAGADPGFARMTRGGSSLLDQSPMA